MKPKTFTIIYWILNGLFVISMLMDGIAGVMRVEAGKEAMIQLGYPIYFLTIIGFAKIFGAIAIVQNQFTIVKEWAFAGFAFTFIGAFLSRVFIGNGIGLLIPPVVMLGVMFLVYTLWKKKLESIKL